MLRKPSLARCDNRSVIAQQHPVYGGPEDWLTSATLAAYGVAPLSFDFFIDWSANPLCAQRELWVKRISDVPVDQLDAANVLSGAQLCGDDLPALQAFADRHQFDVRYVIFRDGVDWLRSPEKILLSTLRDGFFESISLHTLAEIEGNVRHFSGGPIHVGRKGLTYGTSTLECHLAVHSDALWPGDADGVLWNPETGAFAVLEFKKHNLETPIADENIQKYMHRDTRKWQRLALLRDRLGPDVFLTCVYYSTRPGVHEIKVERLAGEPRQLQAVHSSVFNISGLNHQQIGHAIFDAL